MPCLDAIIVILARPTMPCIHLVIRACMLKILQHEVGVVPSTLSAEKLELDQSLISTYTGVQSVVYAANTKLCTIYDFPV